MLAPLQDFDTGLESGVVRFFEFKDLVEGSLELPSFPTREEPKMSLEKHNAAQSNSQSTGEYCNFIFDRPDNLGFLAIFQKGKNESQL
jgi:hypothetical protein